MAPPPHCVEAMITKHCPLSDKTKEIVCCFDDPNVECHVPFAGIGEGTSHPMLNELVKQKVEMKTYCFADEESFVPDHFAYVLEHVSDLKEALTYMEKRGIQKGLDRMAFHMFNSIIPLKNYNCEKLFTKADVSAWHGMTSWHHEILGLKSYDFGMGCHVQRFPQSPGTRGRRWAICTWPPSALVMGKSPNPSPMKLRLGEISGKKNHFFHPGWERSSHHQILARLHKCVQLCDSAFVVFTFVTWKSLNRFALIQADAYFRLAACLRRFCQNIKTLQSFRQAIRVAGPARLHTKGLHPSRHLVKAKCNWISSNLLGQGVNTLYIFQSGYDRLGFAKGLGWWQPDSWWQANATVHSACSQRGGYWSCQDRRLPHVMTFSACICCLLFCCLALVVHVICVLAHISNPHGRRANGMQDFHLVGVWRLGSAGDARQCAVVAATCTEILLGAGSVERCQRGSFGARVKQTVINHLCAHHSSFFWKCSKFGQTHIFWTWYILFEAGPLWQCTFLMISLLRCPLL